MFRPALCSFLLSALAHAFVIEVPLLLGHRGQANRPFISTDEEWNLDVLPHPDATDHLVFDTVHSLLQHWPNTRMRNGNQIRVLPQPSVMTHILQGTTSYPVSFLKEHFYSMA